MSEANHTDPPGASADATTATLPSSDRRLTIARIETTPIRVPLERTFRGSYYKMTHRSTIIVRVITEEGVVGEAYGGDEDHSLLEIDAIIRNEIAPRLIGEDAMGVERCWELARPPTFDQLRDRRYALVAAGIVDTAIWDAIGKALGEPLWKLWGGYRDRLPMIGIGGYYNSGLSIAEDVGNTKERGLAGMKFKVGWRSPAEDAARFIEAREAAGDDFILLADANQGWTPTEAIEFGRRVRDHGLHWFEEPCRWYNDRRGMRDVRHAAGVPVAAGQSEFSAGDCRDLMVDGAIDFCNFDASWSGGPTEWRRVAAAAVAFDVSMAHHEEPQVAAHLLASIPHGTFLEIFNADRDPIWWNLIANRPPIVDGRLTLPTGPGLGWELDGDYIDAHRVKSPA
jgi:L-alanine-DL-glutamate epimerase-like enolase superfamily enzyme